MKKAIVILFLLIGTAHARPITGSHDHGEFLSPDKFSIHCIINDPGISGSPTIDAYTNGQVDCTTLQKIYTDTYTHAREYLSTLKYDLDKPAPVKTLYLRILTLADLNNPDNFSQTDKRCMYNVNCMSGAYFGRTFYSKESSNINIYVAYSKDPVSRKFSFTSTIKHELMHAILYRYGWHYSLDDNKEHALIDRFLEWKRK